MKNLVISSLLVLLMLPAACTLTAREPQAIAPVKPEATTTPPAGLGWEVEWKELLVKARKEGKVFIYSTLTPEVREALTRSYKEKFNISLEFTIGRSGELMSKILTEKRAGINLVDAYIGGVNTPARILKPEGLLEDINPQLILPEVKDPDVWFEKRLPFSDEEGKYIFFFRANPGDPTLLINTNLVKEGEITSYYDLLQPKWKGQITMDDPITRSTSRRWIVRPVYNKALPIDYFKAFAKQEPIIIRDERLRVEWTARGKYPLATNPEEIFVKEFIKMGMPIKPTDLKEDVKYITSGTGGIAFIKNAPNQNARRAFLNWLLSREGQTTYSRVELHQSTRIDVPVDHLPPRDIRDPNVNYFRHDDETFNRVELEYIPIIQEIFGPLLIR